MSQQDQDFSQAIEGITSFLEENAVYGKDTSDESWKQPYMLHVICGFDISDSMNHANKIGELNQAIPELMNTLADPMNKDCLYVSTLQFNHETSVEHRFSLAKDVTVTPATASGGTDINKLLEAALEVEADFKQAMASDGRLPLRTTLILMSDGQANADNHLLMMAKEQLNIIPIGFGRDADRAFLRQVSSEGTFLTANQASGHLAKAFKKVGRAVSDGLQSAN